MAQPPLLSAHGITKSFGPLRACSGISLSLHEGEIVALLGENGAGKSTFVKLMFGALQPEEGGFEWRGAPVRFADPAAARAAGIGMVHQHFSLFEAFTVAQNIALALPGEAMDTLIERTRTVSETYGLPLDPNALVADLSAGERQRIEIVRCLIENPQLIIMDEPTSVLTPQEVEPLFNTLRTLRDEGRTILYISHKLEEVRALCQSAIVLRRGELITTLDPTDTSAKAIAEAMVGGTIAHLNRRAPSDAEALKDVLLKVDGLSHGSDSRFGTKLKDINFELRRGEVLGIAGMAGNGQSELFACLSGELRSEPGAITLHGVPAGQRGIEARRGRGAAFVPEERRGHSAVQSLTLTENLLLSRHRAQDGTVSRAGFIRGRVAHDMLNRIVRRMDVRAPDGPVTAAALSGGNLQKLVMGRELDRPLDLLVVNQPTWGVDAGASANIRQAILDLAAGGAGVVVISQDLDELFEIADRMAVIADGKLSDARPTVDLSRTDVGLLMGGSADRQEPALAP
ncbi:MAG: ABC transporter ATP-binding protein [Pseudomonadota bacterium]